MERLGKSTICRLGQQGRVKFKSKGCLLAEFLLAQGKLGYFLFRPSANGMRLPQVTEGNLFYSKSTDLFFKFLTIYFTL